MRGAKKNKLISPIILKEKIKNKYGKITTQQGACAALSLILDDYKKFTEKSIRADILRDLRLEMKEHLEELKSRISYEKEEFKNQKDYLAELILDSEDHDPTANNVKDIFAQNNSIKLELENLENQIEQHTLQLKEFQTDRVNFIIEYSNHLLFNTPNPNCFRS